MGDREGLDFLVRRDAWGETRFEAGPVPAIADGQVLFQVERFALTANNISYALSGDMLGYWKFFPAAAGWGRIPAMGFARVIRSAHAKVAEGMRCFGFYPMSRHLVITPSSVEGGAIVDGAPHRAGLAAVYNQYVPTATDPIYDAKREDEILLMRGLFMTSFLADDFLADQDFCGARSVLVSSASSKTSIALAFQLSRGGRARAIGLTSARNREFVRSLGLYDEVLAYDEIATLPASEPAVFVDMAGDGAVTRSIHQHYRDQLRYDCTIGATHWSAERGGDALPGPKPEFFFAPAQVAKRVKDWGPAGLQQRLGSAWRAFVDASDAWLRVERGWGRDAVERSYQSVLAGRTHPAEGHVLSLWDDEAAATRD